MQPEDTIAAIATPSGAGGIGIIRISGPQAEAIAHLLYRSPRGLTALDSHRLYHGHIVACACGTVLDEVLVTLMRKPHSYTGEDVLEIHAHGNPLILDAILRETLRAGARLAQPGEFTRRAFLNGRIDLTQAEAVMGLMTAKTGRGLEIAQMQLRGALYQEIASLRQNLMEILALLEASIDFAAEDGGHDPPVDITAGIKNIYDRVQALLATCSEGTVIRKGAAAVIVGRTNVGKSSLLNLLLGEERAIVTAIAGTTRDFIEEFIDIGGVAVRLTDTAGLRDTDNIIEKAGIDRVWVKISQADIIIFVCDGSMPLTAEDREILRRLEHQNIISVINKADLTSCLDVSDLQALIPEAKPLWISAKNKTGIEALKEAVYNRLVAHPAETSSDVVITQMRHKTALEKTGGHLLQAYESAAGSMSGEFVAFDIREALDSLGEIVGVTTSEDVLDRIFSTFCIGK